MRFTWRRERGIDVGTRVKVSGGYAVRPEWLSLVPGPSPCVAGAVSEFVAGPGSQQAAVVSLDMPLEVALPDGTHIVGSALVLSLRHVGHKWISGEIVAVALRPDTPLGHTSTSTPWGEQVESSAVIHLL